VQVPVFNKRGEETGTIEISDYVFGVELNPTVVHQAVVRQQAKARQGTASTKTEAKSLAPPGNCIVRKAPAMPGRGVPSPAHAAAEERCSVRNRGITGSPCPGKCVNWR
jgi:large subunit ribosomal protein L4